MKNLKSKTMTTIASVMVSALSMVSSVYALTPSYNIAIQNEAAAVPMVYDLSEILDNPAIIEERNGKIVVEKIIGKKINNAGDGDVLNDNGENCYITYAGWIDNAEVGDTILTYCIYNPENNAPDDIIYRADYIIKDNENSSIV